jgi:hypothetical protein
MGWKDAAEVVTVRRGQAQRVSVRLTPASLRGSFRSRPEGADVILFAGGQEQRLSQKTPLSVDLLPHTRYVVTFEKAGFGTVTQSVQSEESDVEVAVVLEKTAAPRAMRARVEAEAEEFVPSDRNDFTAVREASQPSVTIERVEVPKNPSEDGLAGEAGEGILAIQAKPPCRIFVDDDDTGLTTPQRRLRLPIGTHRITLVNDEHAIRDTFRVRIRPGQVTRQIRDLTDQIREPL